MKTVKIFSSISREVVEKEINKAISDSNSTLIDIKFSTTPPAMGSNSLSYHALVILESN